MKKNINWNNTDELTKNHVPGFVNSNLHGKLFYKLEEGNISEKDLNLFRVVDTADEAVEHFNKFYAKYQLKPNF